MYIINTLVKPSENKNSHRKHCLSHLGISVFEVLQMPHIQKRPSPKHESGPFCPPRHGISVGSRKRCTGIQIQLLNQVYSRHWNIFIKTLQDSHSPLIRGKLLLLPLFSYKTASYYFFIKVGFLQDRERKTCCDMKTIVRI